MTFAKILTDSTSWLGKRLTTFHLKYPRYIHSELMTHRVFSKNSGSSRAIPIEKMIEKVQTNPVLPLWTLNQKGMQGPVIDSSDWIGEGVITSANFAWTSAREATISYVKGLSALGIHKQNVNRLLEPWMYIEIVLTGTEFDNWFELRNHPAAQPEIKVLAELMLLAMNESTPEFLQPGQWHVPFKPEGDDGLDLYNIADPNDMIEGTKAMGEIYEPYMLKVSVARCARVSYFNFNGGKDLQSDLDLYNDLVGSKPLHASPAEHQARVPTYKELYEDFRVTWSISEDEKTAAQKVGKYVSNLSGWVQLRKLIECGEFK